MHWISLLQLSADEALVLPEIKNLFKDYTYGARSLGVWAAE